MARSVIDLSNIVESLKRKCVPLVVLDQNFDASSSEGRLMFNMLRAFAEFENDIRRECQQDGMNKAKAKRVRFGRKDALTEEQKATIRRWRKHERFTVPQLMERSSVGRTTIYGVLGVNT